MDHRVGIFGQGRNERHHQDDLGPAQQQLDDGFALAPRHDPQAGQQHPDGDEGDGRGHDHLGQVVHHEEHPLVQDGVVKDELLQIAVEGGVLQGVHIALGQDGRERVRHHRTDGEIGEIVVAQIEGAAGRG